MYLSTRFSVFDFMVFFGTIAFSLSIGIFFAIRSRKKDSVANYFLAERKLSVFPTALSLVVTYQSSVLMIGGPAEVYAYGLKYTYYFIGASLSFVVAGLIIVPVFHPLKLTSVYTYFKLRYQDNAVRYLVFTFGVIYHIFYIGTVTFGTCVALEVLMGIPQWATILIYTIVATIYTSIGGMKAVIWTDVFQLVIMFTGIFAILIKSTILVGGPANILEQAETRLDMIDFRIDPTIRYQFWNLAFGSFTMLLVGCYQQPGMQRIISTPTLSDARILFIVAGLIYGPFAFLICYQGVTLFAYYSYIGCDPIESGRIKTLNQIIPLAVSDLFSNIPGLSGLFVAALSSAALSTLSSCLNSLGAVTYDDIIREIYPNMSEGKSTRICKIVVFLYGVLAMSFTFIISTIPGSVMNVFFAFMGCIDGPTCAVFLVSTLFRKATTKGVFIGALVGMTVTFWLNMGQQFSAINVTPTLPPGPTNMCHILSGAQHSIQEVNGNLSTEDIYIGQDNGVIFDGLTNSTTEKEANSTVLQHIYSISYMYFSLIGCLLSCFLSMLISLCTKQPNNVDEKLTFSFRKHVINDLWSNEGAKRRYLSTHDQKNHTETECMCT